MIVPKQLTSHTSKVFELTLHWLFPQGIGSLICVPTTVWLITARTENNNNKTLQNESQLRATSLNNSLTCNDPVEKSSSREDPVNADRVFLCWIHFLVRLNVLIKNVQMKNAKINFWKHSGERHFGCGGQYHLQPKHRLQVQQKSCKMPDYFSCNYD